MVLLERHPRTGWRPVAAASLIALVVLAIVVLTSDSPIGPDRSVYEWFVGHRTAVLTHLADIATFSGSAPVVYPAALVAAGVLFLLRQRLRAILFVVAFFGGAALCGVVKAVVARTRPPLATMLGAGDTGMSFPSGHTAVGSLLVVGLAIVVAPLCARAVSVALRAIAVLWGVAIGWSRLYLGYHWFTDVIGSALLVTFVGALLIGALQLFGTGRVTTLRTHRSLAGSR